MRYLIHVTYYISCIFLPLTFSSVVPQHPSCHGPLGMENGQIKRTQFFSNYENSTSCDKNAYKARLNGKEAYCSNSNPLCIVIDLQDDYQITGLSLQGYRQYTYGSVMNIWYYDKRFISYNDNSNTINLQGMYADNIEYLPLKPFLTSKLKIQLPSSKNTICLRMEVHGCKLQYNEYHTCASQKPLLQTYKDTPKMRFTQTDADKQGILFAAKYLLLSRSHAWCLSKSSPSIPTYNDWATVDMAREYLIYRIDFKGYKYRDDPQGNDFIAKSVKFLYSVDGNLKSDVTSGKALSTLQGKESIFLDTPLIARYIYVSMLLDETGKLTCIKLELYGCKANIAECTSTSTPLVTQVSTTSVTSSTSATSARILSYTIYEGNRYSDDIKWIDSKYNGRKSKKYGTLKDGVGCLTEEASTPNKDPFSCPTCWIGWEKSKVQQPFILVKLDKLTLVSGIRIHTYVNGSMDALPIKKMHIFAGNSSSNLTRIGYLCTPRSFYDRQTTLLKYDISLDRINLQYVKLQLEYSGQWILVRYIEVVTTEGLAVNHPLKLSKTLSECLASVQTSAQKSNDDEVWKIPVIVLIVIVIAVVFAFFVFHHYKWSVRHEKSRGGATVELDQECVSLSV